MARKLSYHYQGEIRPVRAQFLGQCNACKNDLYDRKTARQSLDSVVFGFLSGQGLKCPVCGSPDIDYLIEAPGYCVDLTFTKFREEVKQ